MNKPVFNERSNGKIYILARASNEIMTVTKNKGNHKPIISKNSCIQCIRPRNALRELNAHPKRLSAMSYSITIIEPYIITTRIIQICFCLLLKCNAS